MKTFAHRSLRLLALLLPGLSSLHADAATGPPVEAQIRSTQDHAYRTRVRNAMREPANFAGHHVLTEFGCGTGCEMAFAIDKQTGRTTWLPFVVNSNGEQADPPLTFRVSSTRVLVKAQRGEEEPGGEFTYELRGGRFVLVKSVRWKPSPDRTVR